MKNIYIEKVSDEFIIEERTEEWDLIRNLKIKDDKTPEEFLEILKKFITKKK